MSEHSDHKASEEVETSPESSSRPMLFEVSWEACNQVGGIYTVIRSKAPTVCEQWGRRYCLIGPYDPNNAPMEFEETPPAGSLAQVIQSLQEQGYRVHHGRWVVSGQPRAILLEPQSAFHKLGEIKYRFWEHHDIGLPADDPLMNQVLAFGFLVERFFHALMAQKNVSRPVIAHFHEWMAGTCIPELRRLNVPLSIVFTTHATSLGRYLAMNDPWFYDHVPFVDWASDARRFNVEGQVRLERAAAHGSHVFTTLSDITSFECENMIGRKPDLLTPNGINFERYAAVHEFQNLHREYKQKINQFVMGHFFPSYTFDLDRTLYMFSSGRYEYKNKGFDLTIEALARLNARLRASGTDRTVVFFLITRKPFRSINSECLHTRAVLEEIRHTCEAIQKEIGEKLFVATAEGRSPNLNDLVSDFWRLRLRRLRNTWKLQRLPSIVTCDLQDDQHDEVLNQIRNCNLINRPEDRVKVIYHPDFVSASEPLFGIDYGQFIRGCHMGIFPSYYEPWGYTPEECAASGIPSVTSDLAGFGTYLLKNMPDHEANGLSVVHRRYNSYDVAAEELCNILLDFTQMDRRARISQRNRTESSAEHFDWRNLIKYYYESYRLVCRRTNYSRHIKNIPG